MPCPVVQWQILAKDPEGASAFYSSLFGWSVSNDNPLGYRIVTTGAPKGIDGGIWPSPPDGHNFVSAFHSSRVGARLRRRAEQLGARVIIPPQTLPGGDVLAIMHDPQGIPFGLMG